MSEEEKEIILYRRIREGILRAQKRLFERKSKLGEPVVVADADGTPRSIPASEALAELMRLHPEI